MLTLKRVAFDGSSPIIFAFTTQTTITSKVQYLVYKLHGEVDGKISDFQALLIGLKKL